MHAIILAAGMGKRLKELTRDNTKCMVKVNGVTLIERALRQLDRLNLTKVVLVVGYEGAKLADFVGTLDVKTPITYVENPIYDKTNNIYSLMLAKDYLLEDDTLLLESDIIFEDGVLEELVNDKRDTLALVDKYESWMDGTCVTLSENDDIVDFISKRNFAYNDIDRYYKTVNVYKFSRHFSRTHYVPFLEAYAKALGNNEYYEQVLRVITMLDDPEIKAKKLCGQKWYEIDDIQDLDIAESLFGNDESDMAKNIGSRFGGYWRYPNLVDFCYLVNPYYPTERLKDELKASFDVLLTQYPSGMRVNSLLAAKNFGVHQEHIVVGNGAAELIKALSERLSVGKTGVIRPTFEEYFNRLGADNTVVFTPENDDYTYSADDIMRFFGDKAIENLILINPDNPSGNYIPLADLIRLCDWCEKRNVRLVADESFCDFADEEDNSLIKEEILARYPRLVVVKSISKSHGVPGLRLGVLASADEELISALKRDCAIWNINSFGEFYMQIAEKYAKDYALALKKLSADRAELFNALSQINGLRPIPSQANYIMAELTNGTTAAELTNRLLIDYNLFIKDLSGKITRGGKQFVRIAVRDTAENKRLVNALREILLNQEIFA